MITFLLYGLILCVLAQEDTNKRLAALVLTTGFISVDIMYWLGVATGHVYYLFGIAITVAIAGCVACLDCATLVKRLHNACIAAIVLNSVDWVLYTNAPVIDDTVYEVAAIGIYIYIWWAMLGKGGADVVGRIERLRHNVRYNGDRCGVESRNSDSGKI